MGTEFPHLPCQWPMSCVGRRPLLLPKPSAHLARGAAGSAQALPCAPAETPQHSLLTPQSSLLTPQHTSLGQTGLSLAGQRPSPAGCGNLAGSGHSTRGFLEVHRLVSFGQSPSEAGGGILPANAWCQGRFCVLLPMRKCTGACQSYGYRHLAVRKDSIWGRHLLWGSVHQQGNV